MSDQIITQAGIPLEEFNQLGDTWHEVINGVLVEKDMTAGFIHSIVIGNIVDVLKTHVQAKMLGYVFGDGLAYILHQDANGVQSSRIPDVSFIRTSSIPDSFDKSRAFPGAPDLAIEVISPTESTADVMEKVRDYLRYGTEQVWAVYPITQKVHQYLQDDNQPRIYKATDTFQVDTLFPDFSITIAEFFADNE